MVPVTRQCAGTVGVAATGATDVIAVSGTGSTALAKAPALHASTGALARATFSLATARQRWHAQNFVGLVEQCLKTYRPGISPSSLADEMMLFCEDGGFAEYLVPGFEHGIGMMGDEWRIGMNDGPFPYWTNPDHRYIEATLRQDMAKQRTDRWGRDSRLTPNAPSPLAPFLR